MCLEGVWKHMAGGHKEDHQRRCFAAPPQKLSAAQWSTRWAQNEHKLWANNLHCKQLHSNHSNHSTECHLSVQCEHPEWSGQKHSKEKVKDMKECSWSYNSIDLFWQLPITHSQFSRCLPVECSCMAPSTSSNVTFSCIWTEFELYLWCLNAFFHNVSHFLRTWPCK